jgi:hypothetical protein
VPQAVRRTADHPPRARASRSLIRSMTAVIARASEVGPWYGASGPVRNRYGASHAARFGWTGISRRAALRCCLVPRLC